MNRGYSIIIPAYNEAGAIGNTIRQLLGLGRKHGYDLDIIVVDDGSTDTTAEEAAKYPVQVLKNLQNIGYGYSIKKGIIASKNEGLIIIDADATYPISAIPRLIERFEKGFDMVVGARQGKYYRGQLLKYPARLIFIWLAEFTTGKHILDINSGLRIFKKSVVKKYFHTLCAGFSFTTTITLAFMLNFHTVVYEPIEYLHRVGKSKVRYLRDTFRTAQIMVEAILYYNPIKIFLLLSVVAVVIGLASILLLFVLPWIIVLTMLFAILVSLVIFSLGLVVTHARSVDIKKDI